MSLLKDTAQSSFFVCCYRDDDAKPGDDLSEWLECLHSRDIETVQVENLSLEGVNMLVSEKFQGLSSDHVAVVCTAACQDTRQPILPEAIH